MIRIKLIFTFAIVMVAQFANATVDYLAVNHFIKQLYWADTDNPPGLIGWTSIPEGKYEFYVQEYLDSGFSFTKNPYLIEEVFGALVVLIIAIVFIRKRNITYAEIL